MPGAFQLNLLRYGLQLGIDGFHVADVLGGDSRRHPLDELSVPQKMEQLWVAEMRKGCRVADELIQRRPIAVHSSMKIMLRIAANELVEGDDLLDRLAQEGDEDHFFRHQLRQTVAEMAPEKTVLLGFIARQLCQFFDQMGGTDE